MENHVSQPGNVNPEAVLSRTVTPGTFARAEHDDKHALRRETRPPEGGAGSSVPHCYAERVRMRLVRPLSLRNGIEIEDPLQVVLSFVETWGVDLGDSSASFDESDLKLANRGGARISAAEMASSLERRRAIERALQAIAPDASLAGAASSVPWLPLRHLFDAFAEIRGIGFSKMTKALHPKRPELVPMLDSVVQKYLADDDLGVKAPFGDRAIALVRGYKLDIDRHGTRMRALRQELARRGYSLSEVRILDLLIWSVAADVRGSEMSPTKSPATG